MNDDVMQPRTTTTRRKRRVDLLPTTVSAYPTTTTPRFNRNTFLCKKDLVKEEEDVKFEVGEIEMFKGNKSKQVFMPRSNEESHQCDEKDGQKDKTKLTRQRKTKEGKSFAKCKSRGNTS